MSLPKEVAPMAKGGERPRTVRRAQARELAKNTEKLARLAQDLPGARPDTAVAVTSVAVVETRARAHRCVFCDSELELRDHRVISHAGALLREVELVCRVCHRPRRLYFRVAAVSA